MSVNAFRHGSRRKADATLKTDWSPDRQPSRGGTVLSYFGTAIRRNVCRPLAVKQSILLLSVLFAGLRVLGQQVEWFTDIEAAQAKARNENKILLLDFTGSDWCPWCQKLKKEILDQPEFAEFVNPRIVAAEVDFPHHKQLPEAQRQVNDKLAQVLEIKGFPTVVLVDSTGRPMGQTGYTAGGPKPFIESLQRIINGRPEAAAAAAAAAAEAPEPPRRPPVYVPIAPTTPIRYDELALKVISGPKNRRMAMINNENFFVGDTAKVKVRDERIEVCCKEIREDSVLITANGKTMELKLGKHQ
jgi:thioredoxin-related protein